MRELDGSVIERNFAKEPLTPSEIRTIIQAAGGVAAVLNTRHAVAKENGWKEQAPTQEAFIAAVQEQSNVIRRPILVKGDAAVVGKDTEQIRALLA